MRSVSSGGFGSGQSTTGSATRETNRIVIFKGSGGEGAGAGGEDEGAGEAVPSGPRDGADHCRPPGTGYASFRPSKHNSNLSTFIE